jgi:hypothetical protein
MAMLLSKERTMTRLQQARIRQAKLRLMRVRLEAALDNVIPTLPLSPSAALEAVLSYAIDGLVAQGTIYNRTQAIGFVMQALSKRGIVA